MTTTKNALIAFYAAHSLLAEHTTDGHIVVLDTMSYGASPADAEWIVLPATLAAAREWLGY